MIFSRALMRARLSLMALMSAKTVSISESFVRTTCANESRCDSVSRATCFDTHDGRVITAANKR